MLARGQNVAERVSGRFGVDGALLRRVGICEGGVRLTLQAIEELEPGERWRSLFEHLWPAYKRWFLSEGDAARPRYLTSLRALERHMPELLPLYERLVELAGGGDLAARFLSLYRPTPFLSGCSQAVWTRGDPFLVRNYDYSPALWEALVLHTGWTGRRVIAMTDCLWGVLDGINDAGLAVSLSFGGRRTIGDGFGITLILRYILELCTTADEAAGVLRRVPSNMSYNVTVVDASGDHVTAFVGPKQSTEITRRHTATNHQRTVEWSQHARATATIERERMLEMHLGDPAELPERFVDRFHEPPLYATTFESGWGTLYTAVYHTASRSAVFRWPGYAMPQSFDRFRETVVALDFRSPRATSNSPVPNANRHAKENAQ